MTTTGQISSVNLYGQGVTGRVNVTWTNVWVEDPEDPGSGMWVPTRTDDRVYYIKDHLGSVKFTVGQAGNLLSANDYYAYGALRQSSNYNSPKERFRFTEKERDTETSLDYFGARYYACPAKAGTVNTAGGWAWIRNQKNSPL